MNCFMGYNPLVAKEVKITTWIKEFDGESSVYPSFPNDGDCFVVFATDEDALTHNALSKKTYTNGDWADAEGGSTPTGTIDITENGESIDVSSYAYADVNVPNPSTGTLQITANGEGIDVSSYAYADVNVSGGGSSDLSTAEVTLNIAHGTSVQTDYPYIDEEFNQVSVNDYENGTTDTSSFIIPLYTEGAYFRMDGVDGEPTIVGDAVYDNGYFIVTGDCTITVTGTPMT